MILRGPMCGKRRIVSERDMLGTMEKPGPGDVYGVVSKLLGYDRVLVDCSDGRRRMCRIRGRLKRRVWMREGDLVLVSPWDFEKETKGDIFWRYTRNQALFLARRGELPDFIKAKIESPR